MKTTTINVSMDKQTCCQCGKKGTGYYEAKNASGKYICNRCVMKNIEQRGSKVMPKRRITKIKIKDKITIIFNQIDKQKEWGDEYSITCSDRARPEFYDAVNALKEHVREMCELPAEYEDRVTVKGVSFSWAQDIMGAVITAQMTLKKSSQPLNINTPHKSEDFYGKDGDPYSLLSEECIDALGTIIEEAGKYIDGQREQIGLFAAAGG